MGLKTFTTNFQNIGKEKTFRSDVDFIDFQNNFLVEQHYSFNDLFEFQKDNKVDIENLDDDFFYSEIGNVSKDGEVEPVKLNFTEKKEEEENYYKKIKKGDIIQVEENDILLSKVRPNLKKYVFVDNENAKYFYTSAFVHLKPKKLNKILYYSLRTIFYDNLIAISRQGKGYPTLKDDDFLYLKFDKNIIDKFIIKQEQIVVQIEPIEQKIKELKATIRDPQIIINEVFAREFGFDLDKFEKLKKQKFFEVDFSTFGKQNDLRFSVKHSIYSKYLNKITKQHNFFLFEKILLEEPQYGSNKPAKDYTEGDIRYIRITDIDDIGNLKNDDIKTAEKIEEKYLLKDNDFLFARSGTVGRSFFYNSSIHDKAIFAGYFIKFVFNTNLVFPLFLLYYSKSFIFDIWKNSVVRTLGQPNINAEEYKTLPIPNIPLFKQQRIVDEIKAELDKQDEIKKQIEQERNKIDEIIEQVIKL